MAICGACSPMFMKKIAGAVCSLLVLPFSASAQQFDLNATIDGVPSVHYQAPALGQGSPAAPCSMTGGVGLIAGSIQYTTTDLGCELLRIYNAGRDDAAVRQMALEAYRVAYERAMFRAGTDVEQPLGVRDSDRADP